MQSLVKINEFFLCDTHTKITLLFYITNVLYSIFIMFTGCMLNFFVAILETRKPLLHLFVFTDLLDWKLGNISKLHRIIAQWSVLFPKWKFCHC